MNKRLLVAAATATATVGLSVSVTAATAADWLYYSFNSSGPKLGRVQLDGTTGQNNTFASFTDNVAGLAVTSSAAYVVTQVNQTNNKTLWKVDDSGAKTNLLGSLMCSTVAGTSAYGLATDGQYLYYICENGTNSSATSRYLARVSLDGTSRNETFSGALTGIATSSSVFTVGDGYAYFMGGTGGGADRVYRVALTAGATATGASSAMQAMQIAWSSAGLFSLVNNGPTKSISRYVPSAFPGWTSSTPFSSVSTSMSSLLAANTKDLFWVSGGMGQPSTITRANADGSGTPNTSFLTATSPSSFGDYVAVNPAGPTGDTPAPSPSPAPAPAPAPAATVLKAPTQTSTPDAQGNVAVTLSLQLDEVGKYTFIFEKVTSNEMSREQATGSSRIAMQKGTRIGKRKLTKVVTAANITTTSAGAKLVMKALLKKAQAKKWNLRVIHSATDGSQTQSVISK